MIVCIWECRKAAKLNKKQNKTGLCTCIKGRKSLIIPSLLSSSPLRKEEVHFFTQPSEQHLRSPAQSQSVAHASGIKIRGQGFRLMTRHCPGLACAEHFLVQSWLKQHFSPSGHSESSEQPVMDEHMGMGFKTGH